MGKVLKIIFITIAVMIGAAVAVLVALMIKSHFDSLKPHLTGDYYTDFKSDYELEKKYAGLGSYEVANADYDAGDKKIGKYRVWYPKEIESNQQVYPLIVITNASNVAAMNYEPYFQRLASWGFIVAGNEDRQAGSGESTSLTLDCILRLNDKSDSVFYKKISQTNIGIMGFSQGGAGAIRAATEFENSNRYKTMFTGSAAYPFLAKNMGWEYDASKISIPYFMAAGTGSSDDAGEENIYEKFGGVCPLVGSYMTLFLIFQGVSTASVAWAILVVKIIDSLDDVLFGFVVDKIRITEWRLFRRIAGQGKYMPWYRLFFWTFPAATILFYMMPKDASDAVKVGWFFVTYLLYDFTCTLTEVPMQSMVTTLTDNPSERNNILTVKGVISVVAAIGMSVIVTFLLSEKVGVPLKDIAIVGAVVFLVFMLPMVFKVKEHNTDLKNVEHEGTQEKYSFKDMLNCVFTNKYIMVYFLAVIVSTIFCTRTAVEGFLGFYIFHDSMVFTYVMLIGFVPGIILSMFCGKIADKFGKRNTLAFIFAIIGVAGLITYFFLRENKVLFIVAGGLCAIPNALIAVVRNYIAPDTIEYTRYKTGKDCAGIFYALQSFINKALNGVVGSVALFILAMFGWQEVQGESFADLAAQGVTQTPEALDALWNLGYLIPSAGFFIAALLLYLFYNLKDKDAELMAQCNAGKITREECESRLSRKY